MSSVFTPPPELLDGNTAFADDVNILSDRTKVAFELLEASIPEQTLLAQGFAEDAEDSALESAASAAAAAVSVGNAAMSADAAAASALDAADSADDAQTAEDSARAYSILAGYSASNADTTYATHLKYQW